MFAFVLTCAEPSLAWFSDGPTRAPTSEWGTGPSENQAKPSCACVRLVKLTNQINIFLCVINGKVPLFIRVAHNAERAAFMHGSVCLFACLFVFIVWIVFRIYIEHFSREFVSPAPNDWVRNKVNSSPRYPLSNKRPGTLAYLVTKLLLQYGGQCAPEMTV